MTPRPRSSLPTYEDLVEENAWLKEQLRAEVDAEKLARLSRAFALSAMPARVVLLLHDRRGRIVTAEFIDEWLPGRDRRERRAAALLRRYICNIRRRMAPETIEIEWGVGYRLAAPWIERLDEIFEDLP